MTYHLPSSLGALGIETQAIREARISAATPEQQAGARAAYTAGQAAFAAGDYAAALREFTRAWSIIPHPTVLASIGSTMVRMGRFQDAMYRYQRYIRENPDLASNPMVINGMAHAQAGMEAAAAATGAPRPPIPADVPLAVAAAVQSKVASEPARSPAAIAAAVAPPVHRPYDARRISIGVAAAAGTGLVLAGIGVWFVSRRKR